MSNLTIDQFRDYFCALYDYAPMDWQVKLAAEACVGKWPDYISLPTGAGKTSTIDIALFALAYQSQLPPEERTAAMRTFLVVDRRTVVSEAYHRACALRDQLANANSGILMTVASRLKSYGGNSPVSVVELRGGIYRSPAWCDSLSQPMIVTSTVDQVGSRLLFRGYGVAAAARPMQAAAIAHDSLIILDEAHISAAFAQTLSYVETYQKNPWSPETVSMPLRYLEMTATPPESDSAIKLEIPEDQLADESTHIGNIVNTPKLARLEVAEKVKGAKAPIQLAKIMAERATGYVGFNSSQTDNAESSDAADREPQVIGIMANMVATAKEIRNLLVKHKKINPENVHLVIGAMRPCDRDRQTEALRELISTGADRSKIEGPIFVVATQCIEVGADYDFDVLVSEAAPISALVQRFGRLNRKGRRDITAIGHVIMRGDRVKPDDTLDKDQAKFICADPIYGNAMSYSWNWLSENATAERIDFGIAAFKQLAREIPNDRTCKMSIAQNNAPVLLPGHMDLLCQTSIDPWPDPDVSLWLHGPGRNDPEVQVCWRADLVKTTASDDESAVWVRLPEDNSERQSEVIHAVSLCPPSVSECLSVPLQRVRKWLSTVTERKKMEADTTGDIPAIAPDTPTERQLIPVPLQPLAWRGIDQSEMISRVQDIRPGDTLVFPVTATGWDELGFIPHIAGRVPRDEKGNPFVHALVVASQTEKVKSIGCNAEDFESLCRVDQGTVASTTARNRPIVRLHPHLVGSPVLMSFLNEMRKKQSDIRKQDVIELLKNLPQELTGELLDAGRSIRWEFYPNEAGIVISGPRRTENASWGDDDGSDLYSRVDPGSPIELGQHCQHVKTEVERSLKKLALGDYTKTMLAAAGAHDWGKADPRFQALLLGGDLYSALWEDKLYAKSAKMPSSLRELQLGRELSSLPSCFRHELLSVALAEAVDSGAWDVECFNLMLHLIATHHGHARPWAPVCDDFDPPDVSLDQLDRPDISLSQSQRRARCDHAIDSPLIDRFWEMNRSYGWWGIAYLESVLRFADWRASRLENARQNDDKTDSQKKELEARA